MSNSTKTFNLTLSKELYYKVERSTEIMGFKKIQETIRFIIATFFAPDLIDELNDEIGNILDKKTS